MENKTHKLAAYLFLAFMFLGTLTALAEIKVVYLKDYIKNSHDGKANGYAIQLALEKCRQIKATKLLLPGGTLAISGDYLSERYLWVSNNDEGLKRIAFDLSGMKNFEIDGNGATLLFSGFVSPFLISNAIGITIKNLSIDYVRTFHSEGIIQQSGKGWLDVKIDKEYPYILEENQLIFKDMHNVTYPYTSLLEFDAVKRETAFMAKDYWINSTESIRAEKLENGNVRIFKDNLEGTSGNVMVFGSAYRKVPCFTLSDSERIRILSVNIYHCGGMGVIAQRTRDIELDSVKVTPAPGSNRVISITADATHFSNCSGYLRMLNCIFENQKDDATNIHGIYAVIDSLVSPNKIIVKLKHPQQRGFNFFKPGVGIEFVDNKSLITYSNLKVKKVHEINKEYIQVIFSSPIPKDVKLLDVVAATDSYPEVIIRNCKMRGNRARGILLGSRGKMLIENNYFHTPGAAILFEGDGTYWYEQSGVRDVVIRNNVFENCNYGVWGNAVIDVGTGIRENKEASRYHKNILIESNLFRVFDPRIVNIYSIDGFIFRDNKIEKTSDYEYVLTEKRPFIVNDSHNVTIE